MDGRWWLGLVAGTLAGTIGCSSWQTRSAGEAMRPTDASAMTAKSLKAQQQAVAAAKEPPPPRDKRLKSETLVKLAALKEQAADDAERPQAERDAFRQQARQAYQKAIDQDSKCTMAYVALAGSYVNTGEQDKAFAVYNKAIKTNPNNAGLWFELGSVHARAKDWTPALECLGQAAQLEPENKQYQKMYGLALARTGKFDDGYSVLVKCMSESEARYNIARMQKHVGQVSACQRQLQLALQANPDFSPAREMLDELGRGTPVKIVKYEEPAKQNAAAPPTDPLNLPPVLLGGNGPAPAAPPKDGFDGSRN
ncbi:MAG TPA: tetratricopeptide repeat protein [Gemmataceae bacterium]|nr:tetratricopeptide repeat protein [Gemmataceae bacterium]